MIKAKRIKMKKSPIQIIVFSLMFTYLCIHCLSLLYPMLWMIMSSFKDSYEYMTVSPFALPEKWLFSNYTLAFDLLEVRGTTFFGMLFNSLWWSIGGTAGGIFMGALISYVMAKYQFAAREFIYAVIILIMIIPIYGSGAAGYKLATELKIINSPLLLVKSIGGYDGFIFLVLYSFFKNMSWSYAEAAFIDGAGHFEVFIKIMLPMALGPVSSMFIISWIGAWNDYMGPLIYLYDMPTLSTGLYIYEQLQADKNMNYPLYFSGVCMCLIPVLTIFIIFQNTIMNSVTTGGLKG